jgi:hypothetical protein
MAEEPKFTRWQIWGINWMGVLVIFGLAKYSWILYPLEHMKWSMCMISSFCQLCAGNSSFPSIILVQQWQENGPDWIRSERSENRLLGRSSFSHERSPFLNRRILRFACENQSDCSSSTEDNSVWAVLCVTLFRKRNLRATRLTTARYSKWFIERLNRQSDKDFLWMLHCGRLMGMHSDGTINGYLSGFSVPWNMTRLVSHTYSWKSEAVYDCC